MRKKKTNGRVREILQLVNSLSPEEKQAVLKELISQQKQGFPISIFRTKNLSGLEAIVIFLKEEQKNTIKEIARLLNRKTPTIYSTYQKAKSKLKGKLDCSDYSIVVPFSVFSERKYSVLESLVSYLKEIHRLKLTEIAVLLNKNQNTIKTVYRRYKDKCR